MGIINRIAITDVKCDYGENCKFVYHHENLNASSYFIDDIEKAGWRVVYTYPEWTYICPEHLNKFLSENKCECKLIPCICGKGEIVA